MAKSTSKSATKAASKGATKSASKGASKSASKSSASKQAVETSYADKSGKKSPAQPQPLKTTSADGKNPVSPRPDEVISGKVVTDQDVTTMNRANSDSPLIGSEEEYEGTPRFDGIEKGERNTQNRTVEQGDSMRERKADEANVDAEGEE